MKEEPHLPCEYARQVGVSDGCLPGGGGSNGRESNRQSLYLASEPDSTEPKIEPDLSEQAKQELWCAVKKHRKLFQDTPGRTNLTQIRIETGNAAPIHFPPYRLPKVRHQAVQNEVQQLLRVKIIEPLTSPWGSPIVLVPKRGSTLRLCVDYRRLNCVTKPDPYPMPRVDDLLERLGQAKYISTLDLTKGYWQVPVHPESRQQTAFITPFGKYQFFIMPFGFVGAPAVFQYNA